MNATIIRAVEARTSETPNAVMTTLASPSLGGTQALSMWQVAMAAGKEGPVHAFDSEQVWTLLSGRAVIEVDGDRFDLGEGDTVRIAGMVVRQVRAQTDSVFLVCGYGAATVSTASGSHEGITPAWIQ